VQTIDEYFNEGVISKSLEEICLIHYTSGKKPWNSWGRRKYEKEFQVYLKESGWFSNIEWLSWVLETRLRIIANEIEKRWKKY
jgi:lipopolysaccharide biosynthesis glycosyltransferase